MIRRKRFSYLGDFSKVDLTSPEKAQNFLNVIKKNFYKKNKSIQSLQKQNKYLKGKLELLDQKICNFTNEGTITELSENTLTLNDASITSNLCLICLQIKGTISIISEELSGVSLLDKIKCITDVLMPDDYFLVKSVCAECVLRINSCYKFKIQCQQSIIKFTTLADQIINKNDDNLNNESELNYDNTQNNSERELETDNDLYEETDSNVLTWQAIKPKFEIENTSTDDFDNQLSSLFDPVQLERVVIKPGNIIVKKTNNDPLNTKIKNLKTLISDKTQKDTIFVFSSEIPLDNPDKFTDASNFISKTNIPKLNEQNENHTKIISEKDCKNLICHICARQCMNQNSLRTHILKHTYKLKKYMCDKCNKSFLSKVSLEEHKILHTNEKPYECEICSKKYKQRKQLWAHKNHCNTKDKVICEICSKILTNERALYLHKLSHGPPKYKCDMCDKIFHTSGSLTAHKKIHKGIRYPCDECNTTFSSNMSLKTHKKRIHLGVKKYKCLVCDREFFNSYNYKQHLYSHSGERPYSCEHCDYKFQSNQQLSIHLSKNHNIEVPTRFKRIVLKPSKCNICDEIFSSAEILKEHLNKQHPVSLKCEVCLKYYSSKISFKNHMKYHSEDSKYKCKVCERNFAAASTLKAHEVVHTGETPFQCKYCNNKFKYYSTLKIHENKHTGDDRFKCHECQKVFNSSGHLKVHMRIHTGEKPFQCTFCDKSFISNGSLTVHTRIHKGEQRYPCTFCESKYDRLPHLKRHIENQHNLTFEMVDQDDVKKYIEN